MDDKSWPQTVTKFFLNEYAVATKKYGQVNVSPKEIASLIYMKHCGYISHKTMKELFYELIEERIVEGWPPLVGL